MICSRRELKFYMMADAMMNRGYFKRPFKKFLKDILAPDYTMMYLKAMRKDNYFSQNKKVYLVLSKLYWRLKFRKLGYKLGYSIGSEVLGYGVSLPHHGTIVVGSNTIGNYAVLQVNTCITGNHKVIGNALYMSTGAVITSKCLLGDNVTVGANSVVNKSFPDGNVLLVGIPAIMKQSAQPWYIRDGKEYSSKVEKIETLKNQMNV